MQMREGSFSTRVLLFFVSAVLNLGMIGCEGTQASAPPPAPEVKVAPVIQKDVPVYSEWVATLDGYVNRSEEHTSELQSHLNLVCRLLLEKKKNNNSKDN